MDLTFVHFLKIKAVGKNIFLDAVKMQNVIFRIIRTNIFSVQFLSQDPPPKSQTGDFK